MCSQCLSGGGSRIIGEMSQLYLWLGLGILWEKVMASNCLDWRKVEANGMRAMTELEMSLENAIESSRTGERGLPPQSAVISIMEQE